MITEARPTWTSVFRKNSSTFNIDRKQAWMYLLAAAGSFSENQTIALAEGIDDSFYKGGVTTLFKLGLYAELFSPQSAWKDDLFLNHVALRYFRFQPSQAQQPAAVVRFDSENGPVFVPSYDIVENSACTFPILADLAQLNIWHPGCVEILRSRDGLEVRAGKAAQDLATNFSIALEAYARNQGHTRFLVIADEFGPEIVPASSN